METRNKRKQRCNFEWKDEKPTILVLGGIESNKMYLLDSDRTQWSTLSFKLPTFLESGGAAYLNGEIYIFGGSDKKTYKLSQEMKWIPLAYMQEKRKHIANSSVVLGGCIWVFGGYNDLEKDLNSVEKYIPGENRWIQIPQSMNNKRGHAAAAAYDGKLFVSGGKEIDTNLISMECFNPTSKRARRKWRLVDELPSAMWGHAMVSDGNCLIVLGEGREKKYVWEMNPKTKAAWKKLPQLTESRWEFTANLLGKDIFAIGGWGVNNLSKTVEFFNGEDWEYGPELPEEISGMCSIVIPAKLAAALSYQQ